MAPISGHINTRYYNFNVGANIMSSKTVSLTLNLSEHFIINIKMRFKILSEVCILRCPCSQFCTFNQIRQLRVVENYASSNDIWFVFMQTYCCKRNIYTLIQWLFYSDTRIPNRVNQTEHGSYSLQGGNEEISLTTKRRQREIGWSRITSMSYNQSKQYNCNLSINEYNKKWK